MPGVPTRAPRAVVVLLWGSALVTVGALVGAAALREVPAATSATGPPATTANPVTSAGPSAPPASSAPPQAQLQCGPDPCRVIASTPVEGDQVELLADAKGTSSRLRITGSGRYEIFETYTGQYGYTVTSDRPLLCLTGRNAMCLVNGSSDGNSFGSMFLRTGTSWSRSEVTFISDAGYLGLHDVSGDGLPDVVAVMHGCTGGTTANCKQYYAQVITRDGALLGCTRRVAKEQLPGWPAVAPPKAQLKECTF